MLQVVLVALVLTDGPRSHTQGLNQCHFGLGEQDPVGQLKMLGTFAFLCIT